MSAVHKVAAWIPMTREMAADMARTWQERAVILGSADPPAFPRLHLFRSHSEKPRSDK